jgi:hypothetical protein
MVRQNLLNLSVHSLNQHSIRNLIIREYLIYIYFFKFLNYPKRTISSISQVERILNNDKSDTAKYLWNFCSTLGITVSRFFFTTFQQYHNMVCDNDDDSVLINN